MRKNNKISSYARKFESRVEKIAALYYDRINTAIENDGMTLDELNKIIVAISKNIPELFKLQSTLQGIVHNSEPDKYENKILNLLKSDPESNELIESLLFKISHLSESKP